MNEIQQNETEQPAADEYDFSSSGTWWSKLRIPIIALIVALVIITTWWLIRKNTRQTINVVEVDTTVVEHKPPPFGQVYTLEDLIINPTDGRRHFMVSIGLEFFDQSKTEEIKKREILLRDNLITFFSAQPLEVLTNIKYRQAIRSRIKKIMDYQLGEGVVSRVFFQKWVIQ
jgi:flagellar basal body-associated protein FliL